jgi:hypothetical protein
VSGPGEAHVYAAAGFGWRVDGPLPSLKDAVKEATGASLRRINRLIQLALVGAGRCAREVKLAPDCGLYLSSGQGALQDSVDVFTQMFVDGQAPKPISFVNTLSNTSCFYVAKTLGLSGRNQFVSSSALPFESALSLALLDLSRGCIAQALVGGVDECVLPLADHRKRLRTAADAPLGEGSHWLCLGREPELEGGQRAIGRLHAVREMPDRDAFAAWLGTLELDRTQAAIAFGSGIAATDHGFIQSAAQDLPAIDYRPRDAYYETVTGAGLCAFLRREPPFTIEATTLLHVNATPDGRYGACLLSRV